MLLACGSMRTSLWLVTFFTLLLSLEISSNQISHLEGNVTLPEELENEHRFRRVQVSSFTWTNGSMEYQLHSFSICPTRYSSLHNSSRDAIAAGFFVREKTPLISYLVFTTSNISWTSVEDINFSEAVGVVALAYLRIQEIDPKGNVVKDWDLSNDLVYNQSWNDAGTSSQDGLYWFKASLYRDDVYLGITHYLPRVFGILSEVNTLVSPRSLEIVVEITSWPYASRENHLKLIMAAAPAPEIVDGNLVFFGEDEKQVYSMAASKINLYNQLWDTKITTRTETSNALLDQVSSWINTVYNTSARSVVYEVEFPKYASYIYFNPTIGQGAPLKSAASILTSAFITMTILAAGVLMLL